MKKVLFIIFIFFISCKTNQNVVVTGNTLEIISDDFGPFTVHTEKLIFKSGTDELIENYTSEILAISKIIKKISDEYTVEISGHTDSVGDKDLNFALSQKRAEKIKKLLIQQGCEASKLVAKGYGETRPLASNKTKNGRQQNRRIEIIVIEN
ncbi:outer membrane porin F [Kordia sp. SMS9]|uniref:OmpA family protein n=1 Tax=Kordia sp. SMS9 TaxID=2282170 RepID=UPI000E0DE8D8|nr:OmpA family protein [Kordia sp. SMS9]AXG68915.1 outer membrane porin F [Kordia sp. SMS9]